MKLGCYVSPHAKINAKWVEDLHIRPETINYMEENINSKLMDLGFRDDFMNLTAKTGEIKAKINE